MLNTAVLTGRQVSQAMKVFIVSQAGKAADVTFQASCHSEDDSVLKVRAFRPFRSFFFGFLFLPTTNVPHKIAVSQNDKILQVSSSCSSVYVDGSEARGSVNGSVVVKYGTYIGLARFTVWMPEFPLDLQVSDTRLSQLKSWRVPDYHPRYRFPPDYYFFSCISAWVWFFVLSSATSLLFYFFKLCCHAPPFITFQWKSFRYDAVKRPQKPSTVLFSSGVKNRRRKRSYSSNWAAAPDDMGNVVEKPVCRLRYQQTPVEVYAHFMASDHDSGRISYLINRRTWLRVTDLVLPSLRVSDPRIATLHGRILQGRSMGKMEVQVLSPITGRVIGAKEIRVGNDKVGLSKLLVQVVSGLQLNISPDSSVDNGYVAETSVTRKLTAQYQVIF